MSTTKDVAYQGFLKGLKGGDRVLVCFEDGEIYCAAEVFPNPIGGSDKRFRVQSIDTNQIRLYTNDCYFMRGTGKQWGGDVYLQPFDEMRYQAKVAEWAAISQGLEQQRKERAATKRSALLLAVSAVTVEGIEYERLERLSTSELEALSVILGKLKGE